MKIKKKVWAILGVTALVLTTTAFTAVKKAAFPKPSGPHSVGTLQVELRDDSRAGRKLLVQFYYPAQAEPGAISPYTTHPEQMEENLNALYGVPRPLLRKITRATVPVQLNAEPAAGRQFPLLVFSHGYNGARSQNSFLLPELASQGYVIASIEHTGASSGAVFQDGSRGGITPFDSLMSNEAFSNQEIEKWTLDQSFVLDQIETLSRSGALSFGHLLDLERVGAFGHSFGGATSAATLTRDARFRAGINLDGFYFGDYYKTGFSQPFLELRADNKRPEEMTDQELKEWKFTREQYRDFLFDEWGRRIGSYARKGYESYTIRYANHMSFSDFSLMMPFAFLTAPHRREHNRITIHFVLDFFNRNLKGAASAELPEGLDSYIRNQAINKGRKAS